MMRNGVLPKLLTGAAVALFLVVSAARGEMVLHDIRYEFKGFDPVDSGDVETAYQVSRVYEGLFEYDYLTRPYKVVPRLAEALPEVSADGLTYTFKLKRGVHFSDDPCFPGGKGREVTAEDFIYSFKRVLDPKMECEGDWIFSNHVLGVADWVKKGDTTAPIPGFVAVDPHTLQIKLRRPYPQLLWVLTMTYAFVVPREAVAKYGIEFRSHPVGTGPYLLKSWRRNYRLEYVRNPQFSGQTFPVNDDPEFKADAGKPLPFLDRIIYYDVEEFYTAWQLFLAGQVAAGGIGKDYFEKVITPNLELSAELKKKGIRLYKTPELSTDYVGFNMRDPVVGASPDPVVNDRRRKLRQAFACALDTVKYCEVIANNRYTPANHLIPPGIAGHTDQPNPYQFDLARAKRLLAEAGYPDGKDANGKPLRLTMISPGAGMTEVRQEGDFYQEQLRALGIDLDVQQLTFTEYLRREHDGETQVFWGGWVADYPDAENFLKLFYGPNKCPGVNGTNYANPEFDKLYERISTMADSPERAALYERMADMVMADCPWALLDYRLHYGLFQPWFQGYKPSAFPYPNVKFYKVLPH